MVADGQTIFEKGRTDTPRELVRLSTTCRQSPSKQRIKEQTEYVSNSQSLSSVCLLLTCRRPNLSRQNPTEGQNDQFDGADLFLTRILFHLATIPFLM